jgi:hypothetical protein
MVAQLPQRLLVALGRQPPHQLDTEPVDGVFASPLGGVPVDVVLRLVLRYGGLQDARDPVVRVRGGHPDDDARNGPSPSGLAATRSENVAQPRRLK